MGGGHMTRRDAEHVRDETSGIGPGLSGCRDGVRTGVERVITVPLPVVECTLYLVTFKKISKLCVGLLPTQMPGSAPLWRFVTQCDGCGPASHSITYKIGWLPPALHAQSPFDWGFFGIFVYSCLHNSRRA